MRPFYREQVSGRFRADAENLKVAEVEAQSDRSAVVKGLRVVKVMHRDARAVTTPYLDLMRV